MKMLSMRWSLQLLGRRSLSSATAAVTRTHRSDYLRLYKTKMVLPDGSSVTIRHPEPRQIISLPIDVRTLSEREAKVWIEQRRPKTKVEIHEEEVTRFDSKRYIRLMKSKKD